ncbi:methylenetetrahydrofolate reductase [Arthrobacter sp. JSM 101049]|uniref:methylenetetrahydrofolate reductase n=1 Tax=Arthrobacter sp. JSM 101049 TaxID=929097 RepID=UPI0035613FD4
MPSTPGTHHPSPSDLVRGFSLEMTGKDSPALAEAVGIIPPGTHVNVTYLGNEDLSMRVAAAAAVRSAGFDPVPHISARRVLSTAELDRFLQALQEQAGPSRVFAVGGDPAEPLGPYPDALSLITSGRLEAHGITQVAIAGYPEGHPEIDDATLWKALQDKAAALHDAGFSGSIITQFGFDTAPVLTWLAELRDRGIDLPVRIGVPGPAGIKRLLAYARRFGVASSAGIAHKYGFSLTNLLGTTGPDRFVADLAAALVPDLHGEVGLHLYTFGGLQATARWAVEFDAGS